MLSICIPSYNRYLFLQWCIVRTRKDFPNAQIIVSDNDSHDLTSTLLKFADKDIQQNKNIGPFPNMREVLLVATTKYCMYLADDDYLLPDQVQKGIDFLNNHPDVVCYYAPCEFYDEVNKKSIVKVFYEANGQTFNIASLLWNFVIDKHVWPEHVIWRREGLEKILQPRTCAYWAFIDLANAFLAGPVHFAREPFYRSLVSHPIGERIKLGDSQCLTDFDEYRAGLELMAYELFRKVLSPALKQSINEMIQHFIARRIEMAYRILFSQGKLDEAEPYRRRLKICGK